MPLIPQSRIQAFVEEEVAGVEEVIRNHCSEIAVCFAGIEESEKSLHRAIKLGLELGREAVKARKESGCLCVHEHGKDCGIWCRNMDAALAAIDDLIKSVG